VGIIIADDGKKTTIEKAEKQENEEERKTEKKRTRKRQQRRWWYPQVRAPLYTRLEEAPRLRGHSKFSGLFRHRWESPSKLMLPGHANLGRSDCSIFLVHPSFFSITFRDKKGIIFII